MTKKLVFACTILALAGTLAAAQQPPPPDEAFGAGPGPGPGGPGGWWTRPGVVERLDLTADQRTRIDEIVFKSGERMIELRAAREKAQLALAQKLSADTLDNAALDRIAEELAGAQCAIEREQLRTRIDIARVLDVEQRREMRELLHERRETRRENRRRGTR